MRKVILGVAAMAAIVALAIAPFGVQPTLSRWQDFQKATAKYSGEKVAIAEAQQRTEEFQKSFDDSREFEVYYGDVSTLVDVLNAVAGISVSDVIQVEPLQQFNSTYPYTEEEQSPAVRLSLVVESAQSALKVVSKLQLPLYSVTFQSPNLMDVVFLTGGDVE